MDEVEARSDLWAVGATLFTLVTGEHVHRGETPNEQLGRAMTIPARSLGSVASDLPLPFVEVVDRALRYERDERWPDARAMRGALREVMRIIDTGDPASGTDSWVLEMSARPPATGFGVATLSAAANSAGMSKLERAARGLALWRGLGRSLDVRRAVRWASLVALAVIGTAAFFALKVGGGDPRAPLRAAITTPLRSAAVYGTTAAADRSRSRACARARSSGRSRTRAAACDRGGGRARAIDSQAHAAPIADRDPGRASARAARDRSARYPLLSLIRY